MISHLFLWSKSNYSFTFSLIKMPVVKTITEGNVTTEIVDLTEGKGHLSTDEILNKTGGKAGQHVEVGPDGKTYTYSVEVEEVHLSILHASLSQMML